MSHARKDFAECYESSTDRGRGVLRRRLPASNRSRLALLAALTAALTAVAVGWPGLGTAGASPAAAAAPSSAATAITVPLITGDQVMVHTTASGRSSYGLLPAAGSGGAAESYQAAGGDRYVVPAAAVPYAGRQLDRSLFDVSALARDGISGQSRLPVKLTFDPGVTPSAPPGVTLTAVSGGSAQGYLTAASGARFATALRRQIGADVAAGREAGSSPLLPGLAAMSLAAAGPPVPPAQPYFPLHILQFNVTDETGQPAAFADLQLVNNDDATRESTFVPAVNGVARIAVPAGDYTVFAFFADFDSTGNVVAWHAVTTDDLVVPDTSAVTTAPVDERSATSAVSVSTPRPATEDLLSLNFYRLDAVGGGLLNSLTSWAGSAVQVFVNPQPGPTVGQLHYVVQWGGAGPAATAGYRYDLAFGAADVPADESFAVRPDQVATVRQDISADPAAGTGLGSFLSGPAYLPSIFGLLAAGGGEGVTMPQTLTQYLGTGDGGQWGQDLSTANNDLQINAETHLFAAGRRYSLQWAHGPLAPGFGQHTGVQFCQACTAGSTLALTMNLSGDSEPDHAVFPGVGSDHFTVYRDGVQLVDADGANGAALQDIPAGPSTYRAVFDTDLTADPGVSQSTRTHTRSCQCSRSATTWPPTSRTPAPRRCKC